MQPALVLLGYVFIRPVIIGNQGIELAFSRVGSFKGAPQILLLFSIFI